jgi:hypothetical protein
VFSLLAHVVYVTHLKLYSVGVQKPTFALDLSHVIATADISQSTVSCVHKKQQQSVSPTKLDPDTEAFVRKAFTVCGGGRDLVSMLDVG